jgi:hypothetical protein
MALTRRQLLAAGGGAVGLLLAPAAAGARAHRAATGVELVQGSRAIALSDQQQLHISDFGRRVEWHRPAGKQALSFGDPLQTRIVAAATQGETLWLLDRARRTLHGVDSQGRTVRQIPLATLQEPADMVIREHQALIADVHGQQLVRLDLRQETLHSLHSDMPLNGPASLAYGERGVTLLTLGDRRLHHFAENGNSLGSEQSPLSSPTAITRVAEQLLVLDRCKNQLCWADQSTPALALPVSTRQQLSHLSWHPGGNLLVSL